MSDTSVISAFSADHVARITGLTGAQLAYWDRKGFFRPTYSHVGEGIKPVKIYTFKDVVGLRVISVFLNKHKLSVQHLRKVAEELIGRSDTPWSSLTLGVCKGEVAIFDHPSDTGMGVITKQYLLVPIVDEIRQVRQAITDLNKRQPNQIGSTEKHRNVAHNALVFAGTRIPIKAVRQFLNAGYNVDDILKEYPSLERRDIEAVIAEKSDKQAA